MTGGFVAPADLFAMCALLAGEDDPDLPPGAHIRLLPSAAIGFPIAPFSVVPVTAFRVQLEEGDVAWRDGAGAPVWPPSLPQPGVLVADVLTVPDGAVDVALEVVVGGGDVTVSLLDRVDDRVISVRSRARYIVAGPRADRVRIEGRADEITLYAWRWYPQRTLQELRGDGRLLGLPIDGDMPPWYTGAPGDEDPAARVLRGSPRRLGPPDRPDGASVPVAPGDEVARVLREADRLAGSCRDMLADPATFPAAATITEDVPDTPPQFVQYRPATSLLARAMDPGMGRFLGLVDLFDDVRPGLDVMVAYAAVGIFAIDPGAQVRDGRRLLDVLGDPHPVVDGVWRRLADRLGLWDAIQQLEQDRPFGPGAVVRGLVAVAAAPPAPDPPAMPAPVLGRSRWLPAEDGHSDSFAQDLVVARAPLGSMVAVARADGGEWVSQHATVDLPPPADPAVRAQPVLLGRTRERPPLLAAGLVSLDRVPAGGSSEHRLALADLFGRFGPPVDFPVPDPARPGPPTPSPRAELVLDGPTGEGGGPASPGHVVVQVTIPSVTERAPGSLEVASMSLWRDGVHVITAPVDVPPPHGSVVTRQFAMLPDLPVGGSGRSRLTVVLTDTAGRESAPGEVVVAYADRRRPPHVETALGIVWTSRPGAAEDVELVLRWNGAANVRYRVYAADARTLGVGGGSRAAVAADGGRRAREHRLGRRELFRLLTVEPLVPVGGEVVFTATFPRSLGTIQFLRIVPVTDGGREAEFDRCPVVPVAVPSDRRPPPPRIRAEVAPGADRARITIEAPGLDRVALRAAEPGLFGGDGAAEPPEYRLRRAAGPVAEPRYAREVRRGALGIEGHDATGAEPEAWSVTASYDDPDRLEPFVRHTYWAEVRMPPERRLPAAVSEAPPETVVRAREPFQMTDIPGLFSEVSAPSSVIAAPAGPPPPLTDATAVIGATAGGVYAVLRIPAPPAAHPRAVGPYLLRIWEQWGDGDILPGGEESTTAAAMTWTGPVRAHETALRLAVHVVVIDPLGRESARATFTTDGPGPGLGVAMSGGWANDVAFSPDGASLAVAGRSDSRIIDPMSGARRAALVDEGGPDTVAYAPQGGWVVASAGSAAVAFDAATGVVRWRADHGETVYDAVVSPDGTRVATAADSAARILDAASGAPVAAVPCVDLFTDPVKCVAFSPDGASVAVGSGTNFGLDANAGSLRVADAAGGAERWRLGFPSWVNTVAFDPAGTRLVAGFADSSVIVVDAGTGVRTLVLRWPEELSLNQIESVSFSPQGTMIAAAGRDGAVSTYDAVSGMPVASVSHPGQAWRAAWSPDGTLLATAADDGACVFDARTGEVVVRLGEAVRCVAFSPDGGLVAAGGFGWVRIIPLR